MIKGLSIAFAGFLAFSCLLSGCKEPETTSSSGFSAIERQSGFQNESQYVVHTIVADIAEQVYFTKYRRLPDKKSFLVMVTESAELTNEPIYHVSVRLDSKIGEQKLNFIADGPIWSPTSYQPVVKQLAEAVKLSPGVGNHTDEISLVEKLLDATPETIERQNEELSKALQSDFANPVLHEKAALLLGAFAMRDFSGSFFEIRSPLSRMTAHLAMAQFLSRSSSFGANGQIAEAMMLTLINNQATAQERLDKIGTISPAVAAMVRGLRARNTGDYRPLATETQRTPFESIQWFYATADRVDITLAWPKLNDEQRQSIDFVRIANDSKPSVEVGHYLQEISIPLELKEIESVYRLSHPNEAVPKNLASILNIPPGDCFEGDGRSETRVHVIGWDQWAWFYQRQLCSTIQQNFHFLQVMLGVPDEAKDFATQCDQSFGTLTLYPFVRRFNAIDGEQYRRSIDEGFKLTANMPQFVPAECWHSLYETVSFAPPYSPDRNFLMNKWFDKNPLPGTVYDITARLQQYGLSDPAPNVVEKLERIHGLAPYNRKISQSIVNIKYHGNPSYEQTMALYGEVLPYSPGAMRSVAMNSLYADPVKFEELMTKAAELDPMNYYELGDYVYRMNNFTLEDKAAEYYQKGYDADPDRVGASNHAEWLVKYYLKHKRIAKAGEIAKEAGDVYSFVGLCALAEFHEAVSNYDAAFDSVVRIEERYRDSTPLLNFCLRYKTMTGETRFDPEVQKRVGKIFPDGLETVSFKNFQAPPKDGVTLKGESMLMQTNGLQYGDVIVAAYGVKVHNVEQYSYARMLKNTPEIDLIVWQKDAYRELRPYVPGHLFGVNIDNYSSYPVLSQSLSK